MNSNGQILVQVWNGDTLTWTAPQLIATVTGNNDDLYRGFDIDYEAGNDRAVIVYNNNVNGQFAYRTWDGATLSPQTTVNIPLGAKPRWIETAANPNSASSELAAILLDRNNDVIGRRWTGAAWSNMGDATVWDNDTASANFRPVGVAWESLSNRALFVWGSNTSRRIYHRVWNGASLNAAQFRNVAAMGGDATWLRVVRDPYSNQILSGVMDTGRDLNTAIWSGPPGDSWTDHAEHDSNTEDGNDRNFDIVFETSAARAGQAWLMWGGRVGGTRASKRRQWNGGAWGAVTTFGDRAALIQLASQSVSGNLFAGIYRDSGATNRFITALQSPGGGPVWSAETTAWVGPTVGNPVKERVTVAADRLGMLVLYDWFEIFP
jgi:hypothetical protein